MSLALIAGSDEYCPHCDNHFVIDALTPKASLQVEGDDVRKDARYVMVENSKSIRAHITLQYAEGRAGSRRCGQNDIRRQRSRRSAGMRI
jgi:hypothetical protein